MNRRMLVWAAAVLVSVFGPAGAASATVTTGHTGSGAPALARVGDRLYAAWTDAAAHVNLVIDGG